MDQKLRTIKPLWLVFTVLLVLLADQGLKFWVKTNFELGQEQNVFGNWFKILFVENKGMAFGITLGGNYGKLILTFFRIFAVAGIIYFIVLQHKKGSHRGFLVCLSLILAGAMGNIIDSVFYGVVYSDINLYPEGWFQGQVVDMLHFPLIHTHYPSWFPYNAGQELVLFSHIFNIADAAISVGVISIFVFQSQFFKKQASNGAPAMVSLN